jgi:hypothetical protein
VQSTQIHNGQGQRRRNETSFKEKSNRCHEEEVKRGPTLPLPHVKRQTKSIWPFANR